MEKHELEKLKSALDELRHVTELHSRTLYGTDLNPGGLEMAVKNLQKTVLICTGALIAFQGLPQVVQFLNHLAK